MYWIESIHGVIVDVVNNLQSAKQIEKELSAFRIVPRRVFYMGAKGSKVYC
jgi:hypothetical protein